MSGRAGDSVVTAAAEQSPSAALAQAMPWREERLWLCAVLLIGFVLRAAYLVELTGQPDFSHPTAIDADYLDEWAVGLASGVWSERLRASPGVRDKAYFRPPGYAYFLAGIYQLFGHDYFTVRVVQMAFGLGTCVLVWRAGRRWYGASVGLAAATLAATYWPSIYYEAELHEAFLLVFLAAAALLVLARQVARASAAWGLCTGLLMGLFCVVRPNMLVFVPVAAVWCWWVGKKARRHEGTEAQREKQKETGRRQQATGNRQQEDGVEGRSQGGGGGGTGAALRCRWSRRPMIAAVAIVAGAIVPIAPVTLRNYLASGEFVLISSNAGMQLLISNHPQATGMGDGYLPNLEELTGLDGWTTYDIPRIHQGVERKLGRRMSSSEVSRFFTGDVLNFVREQPLEWLALMGRKFLFFWGPLELDSNKELHYARQESLVLRSIPVGFTPILAGAMVGTAIALRGGRNGGRRGVAGSVDHGAKGAAARAEARGSQEVGPGGGSCAGGVQPRGAEREPSLAKRVTVLLLLFVLAYWVSFAAFSVTTRYRLPLLPAIWLLCAVAGVEVWRQAAASRAKQLVGTMGVWIVGGVALSVRYIPYEPDLAKWHYFRGAAWERSGRLEEAAERYVQSNEIDPENPRTHVALGGVLSRLGRLEEALRHWDEAARIKPDYPGVHVNRAGVLAGMGRTDEAIALLRRVIEERVQEDAVYGQLAALLEAAGRRDDARGVLERGCETHPESARLLAMLGRLEAREGRLDRAREALERAVALAPDLAPARINLGLVYKELGRAGEAVGQYEAVLTIAPDDVHARHNLGVALAAEGRTEEAIAAFRAVIAARPDLYLTRVELAELLRNSGRAESGLVQLAEALKAAPDYSPARLSLARTLVALGRGTEAVEAYEGYLTLRSEDAAVRDELGALLESLGEAGRAEGAGDRGRVDSDAGVETGGGVR